MTDAPAPTVVVIFGAAADQSNPRASDCASVSEIPHSWTADRELGATLGGVSFSRWELGRRPSRRVLKGRA